MIGDRDGSRSNPYQPNPDWCCEACVFGRGKHAEWCERADEARRVTAALAGTEKTMELPESWNNNPYLKKRQERLDEVRWPLVRSGVVCKGSYALGTACGSCERCLQDPKRPVQCIYCGAAGAEQEMAMNGAGYYCCRRHLQPLRPAA